MTALGPTKFDEWWEGFGKRAWPKMRFLAEQAYIQGLKDSAISEDNMKPENVSIRVTLSCEGNCSETMEVQRMDWGDGPEYYISFRADTFYAGQSVIGIIRERIKLAWLAIRKGNYIHQEILVNQAALIELSGKLTTMLIADQKLPSWTASTATSYTIPLIQMSGTLNQPPHKNPSILKQRKK